MLEPIDIEHLLTWAYREQEVETNPDAHPDARNVHWAVLALPAMYGALIRHFARAGRPPVWLPDPGPVVVLEQARRARTVYAEWVRTLVVLRRSLEGALGTYRVCGPAAGEQNWRRSA